jgi:hypothetical protein
MSCIRTGVLKKHISYRNAERLQKVFLLLCTYIACVREQSAENADVSIVKHGYNDIGLCDTSSIASDILWYQLIRHC